MAKFGIALGSGPRGLGFESRHSDQKEGCPQGVVFFFYSYRRIHYCLLSTTVILWIYSNIKEGLIWNKKEIRNTAASLPAHSEDADDPARRFVDSAEF